MEQPDATTKNSHDTGLDPGSVWRDEVQARVAGYRSRRGRRVEGAFSMRFPFPPMGAPAESSEPETRASELDRESTTPDVAVESNTAVPLPVGSPAGIVEWNGLTEPAALAPEADNFSPDQLAETRSVPAPGSRRKVIAFPKPVVAEPPFPMDDAVLLDQPRILDVPPGLSGFPTTPLLDGLQLAAHEPSANAQAEQTELPLQSATIARRLSAALLDCGIVLAAAAGFGAATYKLLPKLTLTKPLLLAGAAMPILIWAVYQYLFVVYGGRTLGMQVAAIRLSRFDGKFPPFRQRRGRVLALYFSAASLTMGLLWALVDVDALCWHDRISRTYLTAK